MYTIEKGKGGELKPDCLHGHPLIGVEVSTLSTAIDNLDNGLKKASFRPHDDKKSVASLLESHWTFLPRLHPGYDSPFEFTTVLEIVEIVLACHPRSLG